MGHVQDGSDFGAYLAFSFGQEVFEGTQHQCERNSKFVADVREEQDFRPVNLS